ncbi:ATPase [Acidianus sulfidivorans JP7]|uniref:ATPase n=1 Tax=Acidianus sulfidivorans JP7 TaxID=619593 RepID=A0A2U9IQQ0_9CREN|nr:PINc/VapC family ATPase [Acidianus sulfidivorans]AWR98306.1 ATPase [Acidianus sulfidivorans JP7]
MSNTNEFLVDKSALLEGVSRYIESGRINGNILIHRALLSELEKETREGLLSGELALDEIERIRRLSERYLFGVEFVGDYSPNVDSSIREYCKEKGCTIVTSDEIQKQISQFLGINVVYLEPTKSELSIEKMFDENTMSVHLKEDTIPRAKKGTPGNWQFVNLSNSVTTADDIKHIVSEIINSIRYVKNSFIEIERKGSTIVQLGNYRIVITRPPLSDGWEVTITRPVTRKSLQEYNLSQKLIERLENRAEGILIAGSPGMGKTTFAQALAEYYMKLGKIVKTIESPRDMHLPPDITQYSKNYAEIGELHDILLLSRPDYTVYDEMRNDDDFRLYIDLRLAGIGMIGVVHATTPIDAIHRFLNRVDLGTIPGILDTVIFISNGNVEKVYSLEMTVKVPLGLKEADLARPVVEIKDFLTDTVEYEIYVFGEQTMIVPATKTTSSSSLESKIAKTVMQSIPDADVKYEKGEYIIKIPKNEIGKFNRRLNNKIRKLEKKHGIKIKITLGEEGSNSDNSSSDE